MRIEVVTTATTRHNNNNKVTGGKGNLVEQVELII